MRIVIAVNHFHPLVGGCEAVSKQIAEHMHIFNHEVIVYTRRHKSRNLRDYPYRVVEYIPGDTRGFQQDLRKISPDLLFVYSDMFDFFRTVVLQPPTNRIIIALCGANWLHDNRNFIRIFYRSINNIERLICHSNQDRDFKLCSVPELEKKLAVIPNGVDLTEFDSNNLTRAELLPEYAEQRWILNVSNFFPGKGQNHLIPILNSLNTEHEYAYIQISSDIEFPIGSKLESEWAYYCSKKLNKNVRHILLKNLDRKRVVGFFKQSNVFAFSSEKEVAPLVLLECMAARLPWVSTNVGNAKTLCGGHVISAVKNPRNYSIFDERVIRLFSKAIDESLQFPNRGSEGRRYIEQYMTWNKVLDQYLKIFEPQNA